MVKVHKSLKKHSIISDNIVESREKWGVFL